MRSSYAGERKTTLFSSLVIRPVLEKLFEPVNTIASSTMIILLCMIPLPDVDS